VSIAATALAEAPIAGVAEVGSKGGKPPPKRLTIATAEAPLVPEAR
jgi:hypothetical protein